MTTIEELYAAFQRADDYMQERRLRARRINMPSDTKAYLSALESRVEAAVPKLPEPVRSEYSALMAEQIEIARNWLARGNEEEARTIVALLFDNYERLLSNIDLKDATPARKGRSAGGHSTAEQKQAEAEENVAEVRALWHKLGAQGRPERERAAVIASRMGRPIQSVRRWIRKANLR